MQFHRILLTLGISGIVDKKANAITGNHRRELIMLMLKILILLQNFPEIRDFLYCSTQIFGQAEILGMRGTLGNCFFCLLLRRRCFVIIGYRTVIHFSRPYKRSRLWYDMLSVLRLSSVCNVYILQLNGTSY